jgi:hypothetical protein
MPNLSKLYNADIPIKASDHINNINEKIHEQLFNDAIDKYFKETYPDEPDKKSNYKII